MPNGVITGRRLFTDQFGAADGYEDLRNRFDSNGDGVISGDELNGLDLWVDDGDARIEAGEIQSLSQYGITEINATPGRKLNSRGESLLVSDATADLESSGLVTYSLDGTDADLFTIDPNTGELNFREAPDFENPQDTDGDNVYDVNIIRTTATSSERKFTQIKVQDVIENVGPDAIDDNSSTEEDTPITIDVLSNDSDPDQDPLQITNVADPLNGTATIQNGKILYVPDAGFVGNEAFAYTISDGNSGEDTATVSVTVSAANNAPIAVDDEATIDRDQTIVLNVAGNDTDVDGDPIQLVNIVDGPSQGAAFLTPDGQVVYDPNPDSTGMDTFIYQISDGSGGTDLGSVKINIDDGGVTPPPPGNLSISGQVRNDLDGDGNLNNPDPGIGGVRIQLFQDFNKDGRNDPGVPKQTITTDDGSYQFNGLIAGNYIVREIDPNGAVSTADSNGGNPNQVMDIAIDNANLTVAGVDFLDLFPGTGNDDPIAINDTVTTIPKRTVNIKALANDLDPNGDPLTITDVTDPSNGTAIIKGRQIRYIPDADFIGMDIFEYAISDGNGGTDVGEIKVTVNHSPGNGQKIDLIGTNRADRLKGGRGRDNIIGRGGNDMLLGREGSDCLHGDSGRDTLKGMGGNDDLRGGAGSDNLYGGGGRDILVGQNAADQGNNEVDTLVGGAGKDIFVLGDRDTVFYDLNGDNDYAKIEDFNSDDQLRLKGIASDYRTSVLGNNTYLYCRGDGGLKSDELVAILNDVDSLNLSGNQVQYV